MRENFTKIGLILLIAWLLPVEGRESGSALPHRTALDNEVKFWKKVFSKYSLDQYVIHDSENLTLVYKVVTFDSTAGSRQRDKELKAAKEEVKDLLVKFHSQPIEPSQLTPWELEVYNQFSAIKEEDKFLTASERIRAQQGIRENFLAGVQRSFAYLPHIKKIFAEIGLPRELIYLPHVESSFNPNAQSHVGASGMWQFMRGTARLYMKLNNIKDERFDPFISTSAAARLLKYNYNKLNDWALAITAYNHGLGGMQKAKSQYSGYLEIREKYLRRSFGFASKNFYPELLAVVEICDSLDHYFPNVKKDSVLLFHEITLPKAITFNNFSKTYKLDVNELKTLNPGFKKEVWRDGRSVPPNYMIRLPITANSLYILASLGGSKEDVEELKLAKIDPYREKAVLTQLKDLQTRRKIFKQILGNLQTGVELSLVKLPPAQLASPMFALETVEQPLKERAPNQFAAVFPRFNVESANLTRETSAALFSLEVPSVPASPTSLIAKNWQKPFSKPELAKTNENFDLASLAVESPVKPFSKPELAKTNENFDRASLAIEPPVKTFSLQENHVEKPGRVHYSKPAVMGDLAFISAPPKNFKYDFNGEAEITKTAGGAVESASFEWFAALKPGVENLRHSPFTENFNLAGEKIIARVGENSTPEKPSIAANKHSVEHSPPYFASLDNWTITYNAMEIPQQQILSLLRNKLDMVNNTITVYPQETLGHFSDWLNINTLHLRRINGLSSRQSLYTGQRLELDFSRVSPNDFLEKRLNYHVKIINDYLDGNEKITLIDHTINAGENLWNLAHKKSNFTVNLLLYFNDLDKLERLYPGDVIKLPVLYNP